ncbi:hypothetical protein EUA93_08295 [Nocardioides oleivorans]|uniref:alpha-amylase n=1 Tax=Nocardioides oleivorans TaxID=273676 RepID=A0A4Q2S1W5_9ACTN|nr:carboxypeptidase regulatory-like domain-containing protein [Nocardioides oleivorans]RYB94344.1 hypothetical protein EUA93_08295 [Nocardioides oleivorans]
MSSRLRRPAVALLATTLSLSVLGLAPAAHAADGSISGHITTGGVDLTDGVYVSVFTLDGDQTVGEEAYPDEDGNYVVEGVAPGTYVVTFQVPDGTYVYEAYNDATQFEDADPVTVASGESVTGIDADMALSGQITGVVESSAGPLADASVGVYAEVSLPGGGTDWDYVDGASTNDLGSYEVEGLEAGSYLVDFSADGYQTEYFDDAATIDDAALVEVEGGEATPDIDAVLAEDATISGTVTGAEGQPLPGTYVIAYADRDFQDPADITQADTDGGYTLDGLRAAGYVVYFSYEDDSTQTYLDEYYDNVGEEEDATVLGLAAGDDEVGIDAQLIAGEHVPVELPYVVNVTEPTISGTPYVGATLTANPGTWTPTPTSYEYYWFAGNDFVQGGTSATYVPTAADLGKVIGVLVEAYADGHDNGYAGSAGTAPVTLAPVPVPPVATPTPTPAVAPEAALTSILKSLDVKGAPKVGSTVKLTGLDASFRTAVKYKLQWYAGSKAIKKATKSKLKITSAMKGKKISVKVTATAAGAKVTKKLILGKAR